MLHPLEKRRVPRVRPQRIEAGQPGEGQVGLPLVVRSPEHLKGAVRIPERGQQPSPIPPAPSQT